MHTTDAGGEGGAETGALRSELEQVRGERDQLMDRLRRKGFLSRKKVGGIYQYAPKVAKTALLERLVCDFVENTLGGSLTPFLVYLTRQAELTPAQLTDLKQIVDSLDAKRREGQS